MCHPYADHPDRLATVLIGSDDLWYVHQNTAPTPGAEEDAAAAAYRRSLDRAVREMQAAGAVVVVGLPDITEDEVRRMADLARVLARIAGEVAAAHGARTVDTNDPFRADPARMDPDGIHPNAAGYAVLAGQWMAVIDPLL